MSMFSYPYHSARMRNASSEASGAKTQARRAEDRSRDLEGRLEKLSLVCAAMWELFREKTGLTEEDLMSCVRQIDLADGRADGKVAKTVSRCAKCDRVMSARHTRCIYCGAERLDTTAFDTVL